ncbi:hypothetical protein ABFS82_10G092000 [Erythranthe guttata]|uniref:HMA domain-containing protein n=1 Tax=Erythranthe guttata TaxID=4155 RepID=A0A022QPI7_ERYGU|nr:PREDICTED: uncharacterized protein LOC105966334 [Erythranthe guttata]EYU29871.1 hypothetical protein MIMGU_mgv1a008930mg [Erythranthe guttata]|eukprot:XP_012846350.1 PREDICTED: uncharacterized protein LOC105966334 [Erythranthe guttata]
MGEKEGEKKAAEGGEKKAADGGGNKNQETVTVVLKLDLHCEGCAKKVRRSVSHFEGVEKVKADCDANKLTVTGTVDPAWLRERVEYKTKKKVDLISPQPKKDAGAAAPAAAGGGDKKADDSKPEKKDEKKAEEKKPKEPAVSTVVMKIRLHCDGCAHKIKRTIFKNIHGVNSVTSDLEKDLVTATGTMDVKELTAYLKEKLKRSVEIVPPKKDGGGGDKKEKESGGGGGGEKKEGGGEKKEVESKPKAVAAGGGGGEGSKGGDGAAKVEVNKLEHHSFNPQTHYAMPMYNQSYANQDYGVQMFNHPPPNHGYLPNQGYGHNTGYVAQYSQGPPPPPPTYMNINDQMFSDENPNGCYVM